MTNTPSAGAAGQDKAARPARGLHGRLDTPTGAVAPGVDLVIGGWVVHERLTVDRVLVTVDDEVAGHCRVDVPRPDVRERYPDVIGASHRGWAVTVAPQVGDQVTIRAYAHVETGEETDPSRLGPWIRFAEATLPLVTSGDSFGRIDEPAEVTPGVLRVTGTAWAPGGLARVELSTGTGAAAQWVRARHSLPGRTPSGTAPADQGLAGFAGYVRVPDTGPVTIRAVASGLDGRRHELEPLQVTVCPAADQGTSPERAALLLDRFHQRVRRLSGDQAVPPRVMVAAHALDLGGAQLYLSLLMDQLRSRGFDFCVVARSTGALQADLEAAGIPVLVFGTDPSDREVLEGQALAIAEFAVENGVVGCLANSLPTFPAVLAAERLGLPTTWAIHESFDLDVFWVEAYGRMLPRDVTELAASALADCDEVVFEAEATSSLYEPLVHTDRRRRVSYGVDAAAIDTFLATQSPAAARSALGLEQDALVLACVGTVEARKGQLALVRAFARIPAERRRDVQLAFTGMNDSGYAHALRTVVADAGLTDAVKLQALTQDIYPSYLAADVLVSASDIESVPRTMLEAMLIGRPVAATAAFGVGELVTDGETGFLCEPLDLGALQQMLERVIATDRARLSEMGQAARAHVLREHDPSIYVDHFEGRLSPWVRGSAQ